MFTMADFSIPPKDFANQINLPVPEGPDAPPRIIELNLQPAIRSSLAGFGFSRGDLITGSLSARAEGKIVTVDCKGIFVINPKPQFLDAILDPAAEWAMSSVNYRDADNRYRYDTVAQPLRGLTRKLISQFNPHRKITETEEVFLLAVGLNGPFYANT